jgi:flagellar hook assembly protein FlgD
VTLIGRGVVNGVDDKTTPTTLQLTSVYPNPSANTATVSFYLPSSGDVRVELVDARGALIHLVQNGHVSEGSHDITLDTKSLPNGNYFVLVTANGKQLTKSLTVVH